MTEKLFYRDSHMQSFEAVVVSCASSADGYEAVLDRTAFFPEGGGQAADTGTLRILAKAAETGLDEGVNAEKKTVVVTDVKERDGSIYHRITEALEPGTRVEGTIDWEKRFSRMQQHTGEHIVSGLIHSRFGYDNVGFHLGEEVCTLDLSGPVSKEELKEIEYAANGAVFANLPVETLWPSKEELAGMEYRSKIEIEGDVRIIQIPGYDVCACCAPHVDRTGEIGLIKFVNMQNYKGGVRITMVCGFRALTDYRAKEESVKSIMFSLASKEEWIADAVERLKEENTSLKGKLAEAQHQKLIGRVQAIPEGTERICLFEAELAGNGARELMNLALDREAGCCGVFVGNAADGYRYVIGSRTSDVRPIGKMLNEKFEGRGGGKPEMVQGSLAGTAEEIEACFMGENRKVK